MRNLGTYDAAHERRACEPRRRGGSASRSCGPRARVLTDDGLDSGLLAARLGLSPELGAADAERYGLTWAGKSGALRTLLVGGRGTLRPTIPLGDGFDDARHAFVRGDNLEVLKLLQRAYAQSVRCIYIDPPYNTENTFVYQDDFTDTLGEYLRFTAQVDAQGDRVLASIDAAGRKHGRWLSMMYPRLALARNLLRRDGFCFISINDVEFAQLRLLCDEIFGAENFVETFVWRSTSRPSNMSQRVRRNAEYILCYARDAQSKTEFTERLQDPQGEASLTQANNRRGTLRFRAGVLAVGLPDGTYPAATVKEVELIDDLVVENGRNSADVRIAGRWAWGQDNLDAEIAKGVYLAIMSRTGLRGGRLGWVRWSR